MNPPNFFLYTVLAMNNVAGTGV